MQYQQDSLAMYKIIGTDGQQYGPISLTELQQWVNDGRVVATTPIQPEGAADWRAAAAISELAVLFAISPASTKSLQLASHSIKLGILGCISLGLASLAGIYLGFKALALSKKASVKSQAKRRAKIGLGISFVSLVAGLAATAVVSTIWTASQQEKQCIANVRKLHAAMVQYARNNNNILPSVTNWCDAIMPYLGDPKVFICPSRAGGGQRCHYMFNVRLNRKVYDEQGALMALIFEGHGGWNAAGGLTNIVLPHHPPFSTNQFCVVAAADGTVMSYPMNRRLKGLLDRYWGRSFSL